MNIIDLTHPLNERTPVYSNVREKPPHLAQVTSVKADGYSSYRLIADMHVGTHIDAPAHMLADGKLISDYSIDNFCGQAKLIDARDRETINVDLLEQIKLESDDIILILTGFDKKYHKQEYFTRHPVLSEEFVSALGRHKVKMIGFDMPSPDRYPFDRHKQLFEHDILIIENLTNLEKLAGTAEIELYALPLKCCADGALARVVAQI